MDSKTERITYVQIGLRFWSGKAGTLNMKSTFLFLSYKKCATQIFLSIVTTLVTFVNTSNGNDPNISVNATYRVFSHGVSHQAIETGPGWTLFIGCAHGFMDKDNRPLFNGSYFGQPIKMDGPWPANWNQPTKTKFQIINIDYRNDLSLILWNYGPAPWIVPVSDGDIVKGWYQNSSSGMLLSAGYDNMSKTITKKLVTPIKIGAFGDDGYIYTKEPPWHGRSGGALIDAKGQLVGIVKAYIDTDPNAPFMRKNPNYRPTGPGIYIGLTKIHSFLNNKTTLTKLNSVFNGKSQPQSQLLPQPQLLPQSRPLPQGC